MKEKTTAFWNWFSTNKLNFENILSNLNEASQEDIDNLMDEFEINLHNYDPNIWFRMGSKAPYELLITAEGQVEKFENVIALVDSAPKIENWNIVSFIQPKDITTFNYKLENFELNQDDIFFSYSENLTGENGYYIETMFYVKDDKYIDDESFKSSIIRIAETSLGEYDFAKMVGFINVQKTSDNYEEHKSGLLPIYTLPEISESIKSKVKNYS